MQISVPIPVFEGSTVDDVLMDVVRDVLENGLQVSPTRGPARELAGAVIGLSNPRARLSRTESRGKIFSCLGELCWYLAGTDDGSFITYYIPRYKHELENGIAWGAYGPRLFGEGAKGQFQNVARLLAEKIDSRRAVIQIFEGNDLLEPHQDIPCTCTLQFMVRGGTLDLITYMRSNDAYLGIPHDIFSFTFIQELMARNLGVELGMYRHMVGSLHIYDENHHAALSFIGEGYQSTKLPMPAMPPGEPWRGVEVLLLNEKLLREQGAIDTDSLDSVDPYWQDLVRLLAVFRFTKRQYLDLTRVQSIRDSMVSKVFDALIATKMAQLS